MTTLLWAGDALEVLVAQKARCLNENVEKFLETKPIDRICENTASS